MMIYQRRTDQELIAALDAIEQYAGDCVEIRRVIITTDGTPVKVISRGFVYMPGYEPPSFEALMAKATGRRTHE